MQGGIFIQIYDISISPTVGDVNLADFAQVPRVKAKAKAKDLDLTRGT